jgi:hypothetical protein
MNLLKVVRSLMVTILALGLLSSAALARADENTRPRRVTAEGETAAGPDNGTEDTRRTGVTVTRKRRHGVVRRGATGAAKGTAKGATYAAKGTAKGATAAAKGTAKGATVAAESSAEGAEVAGKSTAKGAKTAARGTKKVGKKVIDAFK